jgi:hypothetical protein
MKKIFLSGILLLASACQLIPSTPSLLPSPSPEAPTSTAPIINTSPTVTPPPSNPALPPFAVDLSLPFAQDMSLTHWSPTALGAQDITLPVNLNKVVNFHVLDGLTTAEQAFLAQNGFVVIHSQEAQFGDIRVGVADLQGQPYYLTTDAAYHAVHLLFDELLKALESQQLSPMSLAITRATLAEVLSYLPEVQGTGLEADTLEAAAYLSVALKLLDPNASIDPSVADVVNRQIDQIMAYGGKGDSVLFDHFGSKFEDDYGAYRPVGHYAGIPELEQYFRAMTWFGRVNFRFADGSRVPVIITLALRRALIDGIPASDEWADIHETLNFMVGPTDDAGPLEYAALMDQVYGDSPTILDLKDESRWQDFLSRGDQLPAPQINSTFVNFIAQLPNEKGWRFMGQRFTFDEYIFQNLIYDKVQPLADGTRRNFPTGLDVMAVLGSNSAQQSLNILGATQFPNYPEQQAKMIQAAQAQTEPEWLGRFYSAWLYSFFPILAGKDNAYPAYMRTAAWGYKDLNAALGSWTELKHDTVLYTKMEEGAGGGGPPSSAPAPSYVEPNPEAFYRMAYMTRALADGLATRLQLYRVPSDLTLPDISIDQFLSGMTDLSARLQQLGQDAADELAGKPISDDEIRSIANCLGLIECQNEKTLGNRPTTEMPKVPVVAAVSGGVDSVLEAGTGGVDRIYVVVPLEGQWEIAQGGVFPITSFSSPATSA